MATPSPNWQSLFKGSAWELDPQTGEYYLHVFSRKQPDLNWENPEVRQAVYAMMQWSLDRGVDGFRMDVINMISKDPELPDGRASAEFAGIEHYLQGPRVHEFLQEMHHEVFDGREGQYRAPWPRRRPRRLPMAAYTPTRPERRWTWSSTSRWSGSTMVPASGIFEPGRCSI